MPTDLLLVAAVLVACLVMVVFYGGMLWSRWPEILAGLPGTDF